MPESKPIHEITIETAFGKIKPDATRQLYLINKTFRSKPGETPKWEERHLIYESVNNAEIKQQTEDARGRVKCVCDGSAEATANCLNNYMPFLNSMGTLDERDVTDLEKLGPICKQHDISSEVWRLITGKLKCALKGLDYVSEATGVSKMAEFRSHKG